MSDPINTDTILSEDDLMQREAQWHVAQSHNVETIRTQMNEDAGQRIKYTWRSPTLILEHAPKTSRPPRLGDAKPERCEVAGNCKMD